MEIGEPIDGNVLSRLIQKEVRDNILSSLRVKFGTSELCEVILYPARTYINHMVFRSVMSCYQEI